MGRIKPPPRIPPPRVLPNYVKHFKAYCNQCMLELLTEENPHGDNFITTANINRIQRILNEKFPHEIDFNSEWKYKIK